MELNKYIDHTLLKADATYDKIKVLCEEAKEYDFASVCVNSYWVASCAKLLEGSDVKVCSVVGFPLGAMSSKAKAFEASDVIHNGASEIDMVLNIGEMKAGNFDVVLEDIKAVVDAADGRCVKVILETCLLTKDEIVKACKLCMEA
ncbi:MAG: deoxyribose-phosphate aldolase, partial [Erysipelotrichaceae bacterium]